MPLTPVAKCGRLRYTTVSLDEEGPIMSHEMMAVLVFGAMVVLALVMLLRERRGIAARRAARGGREVNVSNLIAFGSAAGEGEKTHTD